MASLAGLVSIRGSEHLPSGLQSSLRNSSSNAGHGQEGSGSKEKDKGKDKEKEREKDKEAGGGEHIIVVKFRQEKGPSRHLQARHSASDGAIGASASTNHWWRRGSRDGNPGYEKRKGSAPDPDTLLEGPEGSADGDHEQELLKSGKDKADGAIFILDMRDADGNVQSFSPLQLTGLNEAFLVSLPTYLANIARVRDADGTF